MSPRTQEEQAVPDGRGGSAASLRRRIGGAAFLTLLLCLMIFGLWNGEHVPTADELLEDEVCTLAVAVTAALVAIAIHKASHLPWLPLVMLTFTAPVMGHCVGGAESGRVFNETLAAREEIREAVTAFWEQEGRYPRDLDELPLRVPTRLLRGPRLTYALTDEGYVMYFGDWLVQHRATHERPWIAMK